VTDSHIISASIGDSEALLISEIEPPPHASSPLAPVPAAAGGSAPAAPEEVRGEGGAPICGHVGKRPPPADLSASGSTATASPSSEPVAKRARVEEQPTLSGHQAATSTATAAAAAAAAPAPAAALIGPHLTSWMLTKTDTPTTDESCEDFQRIKRIAQVCPSRPLLVLSASFVEL
jgi:hypothetical protein